jgi:glycerophosphoryl diester phosphodiesterase
MAAFSLAVDQGSDFIELDLQEAADGGLVVFHDVDLERVTGLRSRIWQNTVEDLRRLDAGSHFGPAFSGERIPTLDEVLEFARGRVKLNLELKPHERERHLAESVVRAVTRAGMQGDVVVTSSDGAILERVRRLAPGLRIGRVIAARIGRVERLDVDFYSVRSEIATVAFVRRAHAHGREVHVFTVNDPARMRQMRDRGVDNLITDWPSRAFAVLAERDELDELGAAVARLFQ